MDIQFSATDRLQHWTVWKFSDEHLEKWFPANGRAPSINEVFHQGKKNIKRLKATSCCFVFTKWPNSRVYTGDQNIAHPYFMSISFWERKFWWVWILFIMPTVNYYLRGFFSKMWTHILTQISINILRKKKQIGSLDNTNCVLFMK